MSGPTGLHAASASGSACVISTLPSSPTGDGARTPPICGRNTHPLRVRLCCFQSGLDVLRDLEYCK